MQRLSAAIVVALLFLLSVTSAVASGPPVVNQLDHAFNAPFTEIGFDCATGVPTLITGVFSGVLHTLVQADGSVHFTGAARGSLSEDDLPTDGISDATLSFELVIKDTVFSSGMEVSHATLSGSGTTSSAATVRIHEVLQTVLDQNGNPKVDFGRLHCF